MKYLIAILLPPVAVLLCGKWFQFFLNLLLCLFFWIPGIIHAILVVHEHHTEKRHQKLVNAVKERAS